MMTDTKNGNFAGKFQVLRGSGVCAHQNSVEHCRNKEGSSGYQSNNGECEHPRRAGAN